MLPLAKRFITFARLLATIALIALLQSCTSSTNISPVINKEGFYGSWLLSNPKDLQKDLIFGGLFICDSIERASGTSVCKDNDFILLVLERNFGHGCTDYVGSGNLEFNKSDKHWHLVITADPGEAAGKMKIMRTGKQLHIFQDNGKNLLFELSTREVIDKKLSCPRHL